jgi:hypothetical protein
MKATTSFFILMLLLLVIKGNAQSKNYDLKNWPEGKSPEEIGQRIAEKFLGTAHSLYEQYL